jgi:beta-galactosidase
LAVAELVDAERPGFAFGCDYNPEQWSPETWLEDVRLMQQAGVNLVAINIFGWAAVESTEGEFDFGNLDKVVELLHDHGIGVNLGTGTSSPPPWLTTKYPEILPMVADGTRRFPGGRQAYCPSSPIFREYSSKLVEQVASRFGHHPAVKLWHVSNELGCHNALCYCDTSAEAFRVWLHAKYGSLSALNAAWGTAFWSQRYSAWEQIHTPRLTLSTGNPTQALDFQRFSSDELLAQHIAEAEIIRTHSDLPITTNFMVTAHVKNQDYWAWAEHMDVISNDHYLDYRLPDPVMELALCSDTTRGLAGGDPWLLMEQSTSAVNWQPTNIAKAPGQMLRNSLSHVARGADGICFFQWRASVQGSEKFHSALLPHAGTETKTWREVVELGDMFEKLREVVGSRVVADVALIFSWQARWATDLDSRPSEQVRYIDQVHQAYQAARAAGLTVDVVAPGSDLSSYKLVFIPCLYQVSADDAEIVESYVANGGHVLVTFFSGIADENDTVGTGGYPAAFRHVLGIWTEEFFPLEPGERVTLSNGATSMVWSELLHLRGATEVASYVDGALKGTPAITKNSHGAGTAWYAATQLEPTSFHELVVAASVAAGVVASAEPIVGVETVRRAHSDVSYLFVINHTDADIARPAAGIELLTGAQISKQVTVPAGGIRVVKEQS